MHPQYLTDNGMQLDDLGTAFFKRELEIIKAQSYDVIYPDLPARSLFPVNNEGGTGVTSITYQSFDMTGKAKIINGGAKDLPRADAGGREITNPVRELGIAYGWNVKEIAASARAGRSIDRQRSNAANRAIEEAVNDIAFNGNVEHGLPGFLSNPDIPIGPATDIGGGVTEWSSKTPVQIYEDCTALLKSIFINSKMAERPDTLLLPPTQWSILIETRMADGTDTTIAQFLVKNSPYLNSLDDIIPVNELAGAGTGGVDIMVAYTRRPDKLQLEIPAEMQYLPAQEQGLEMVVPGWLSICGVVIYYPLSASIIEGI